MASAPRTRPRPRAASASRPGAVPALGWVLLATLWAAPVAAQEEAAPDPGAPPVGLDRLLELPPSLEYTVERRGGRTAGEWRERFAQVRTALAEERAALADAEARLAEVASSADAWKVAPALPGAAAAADEAPLDYGLRQEMRRHREEITRLERRLRELEVEADLAGVPESWRRSGPAAEPAEEGRLADPAPR